MKIILFSLILKLVIFAFCFYRILIWSRKRNRSVLILPPAPRGSLGDEAMLSAALCHFKEMGVRKIGIVAYREHTTWGYLESFFESINMKDFFAYGSWKARFRFITKLLGYNEFYCFGADMMDGFYDEHLSLRMIELAHLASRMGLKSTIVGFSFNEEPKSSCIEALRGLPSSVRLNARDPISHQRLELYLDRTVTLTADAAFLLQPKHQSELVSDLKLWIDAEKKCGQILVGINANSIPFKEDKKKAKKEDIVEIYQRTLLRLYGKKKNISFVLIPHDNRGDYNDFLLAKEIREALPETLQEHCRIVGEGCSAAEIKAVCSDLDIVFSGRMHLTIASLGDYQGKVEGLYEHFNLANMIVDPKLMESNEEFVENYLLPAIENRVALRDQVNKKLDSIRDLAVNNFDQKE
jgi:polysaccharide pyruvyl transferase WcaK-like protein